MPQPKTLRLLRSTHPMHLPQILHERQVRLRHVTEVLSRQFDPDHLARRSRDVHDASPVRDARVGRLLRLKLGERKRRLARVADLPAVPPRLLVVVVVVDDEPVNGGLVQLELGNAALLFLAEALLDAVQVDFEDGLGGLSVERGVIEGHVDSRGEGFVERAHAVSGEEEDTVVVL